MQVDKVEHKGQSELKDNLRYILQRRLLCVVSQTVRRRYRDRLRQRMSNGTASATMVLIVHREADWTRKWALTTGIVTIGCNRTVHLERIVQ